MKRPVQFVMIMVVVIAGILLTGTCLARAQVTPLEAGASAPRAGMLIPDDRLIAWRHEIERLRFELQLATERCAMLRAADDQLDAARQLAADEQAALRERLWGDRVRELTEERNQARARQGPRWWQRGAVWLPVGLVAGLVTGLVLGR